MASVTAVRTRYDVDLCAEQPDHVPLQVGFQWKRGVCQYRSPYPRCDRNQVNDLSVYPAFGTLLGLFLCRPGRLELTPI
eukprot:6719872-Pyramimonas_sp.AAC.2